MIKFEETICVILILIDKEFLEVKYGEIARIAFK